MAVRIIKRLRHWARDHEFRLLGITTFVYLLIGMEFYHLVEKWRYLDAAYFSVTTLTTVGYGDFSPQTDLGKAFTIGYILLGIGLILGFVDVVALQVHRSPIRSRVSANHENDSESEQ